MSEFGAVSLFGYPNGIMEQSPGLAGGRAKRSRTPTLGHGHPRLVAALREHGAVRGVGLASWRILRCNPFSNGGYDPVPPRRHTCEHDHASSDVSAHV